MLKSGVVGAVVCAVLGLASPRATAQVSPISGQDAPYTVCFADGTSPDYIRARSQAAELHNQFFEAIDYHVGSRWSGSQGTPRTVTWSLVPDGLSIPGSNGEPTSNSNLFATLDSAFAAQGGRATWINRIQQCFDRWHQVSGITFVRVTVGGNDWDDGAMWGTAGAAGARGDMRISMHLIDGSSGVLAYCFYPTSGDMVLDSGDAGNFASSTNLHRFFRNTVTHEMGHGIGIQHTCSNNSSMLMEPLLSTGFDGPRQDDIRAAQRHYGDPFESNESSGTATALGTLNTGGTLTIGDIPAPPVGTNDGSASLCSIDADGKADWHIFTVATGTNVNFTLTPIGTTYDDNSQQANGTCNTGTSTNALAAADLAMGIYASNGSTLLATGSATGAGLTESVTNLSLSAGQYYVRVYENNSPTQLQSYRLTLTSTCAIPVFTQPPTGPSQVELGAPFSLTAAATGATGLQWRKGGVNLVNDARISGVTTPTLSITAAVLGDTGEYDLVATNACGPATSQTLALAVTCYANCDGSTQSPVLNVNDFSCFLVNFAAGSPWANCDQSVTPPTLNVQDFSCFLTKFATGCGE